MRQTITPVQLYDGDINEIIGRFLTYGWRYLMAASNLANLEGRPNEIALEAEIQMFINPAEKLNDASKEGPFCNCNSARTPHRNDGNPLVVCSRMINKFVFCHRRVRP